MATEVEQLVRQNGSVPATIGIIAGKVHVGKFIFSVTVQPVLMIYHT